MNDHSLLNQLRDINSRVTDLSAIPANLKWMRMHPDLNLPRESLDKLIHRVERILE